MDTQDRSNHLLEEAAQRIAEASTSAHLVEDDQARTKLLVHRDSERLGIFEGGTYLYELLRDMVELEERPFRFEVDGTTYIGWSAIGQFIAEENNKKGLLPLQDIDIEVTDSDGNVSTTTGTDVLFVMQQAGALKYGDQQSRPIIRLT